MTSTPASVSAYRDALKQPDEAHLADLAKALTEDAIVAGIVGAAAGRDAVLQALASPDATRLVSAAAWTEPWTDPELEGGEYIFDAQLPPGMALAGVRFALRIAEDGRILRVGQQMLPAAPPSPQTLHITPELKEMIDGALTNGTPVIVAYVDAAGVPHISPRGSVQVLNERQIGVWARDPEGGLPKGILANPNVSLYYRDPKTRAAITVTGKARVADGAVRETIYANQPAIERNFDGRKRGVGLVIDVDQLEAASPAGRSKMVRDLEE